MTTTPIETHPAAGEPTRRRTQGGDQWLRRLGILLLVAAVVAVFMPWRWDALTSTGTTDNRTLDSAGYERWNYVWPADPPRVRAGDSMQDVVRESNRAAFQNKVAADRRGWVLVLALPGAFLVGTYRKRLDPPAAKRGVGPAATVGSGTS